MLSLCAVRFGLGLLPLAKASRAACAMDGGMKIGRVRDSDLTCLSAAGLPSLLRHPPGLSSSYCKLLFRCVKELPADKLSSQADPLLAHFLLFPDRSLVSDRCP